MRSCDTNRVHLGVVFNLIILDPGCECLDVFPGIIQAVGPRIQSYQIAHHFQSIVQGTDFVMGC